MDAGGVRIDGSCLHVLHTSISPKLYNREYALQLPRDGNFRNRLFRAGLSGHEGLIFMNERQYIIMKKLLIFPVVLLSFLCLVVSVKAVNINSCQTLNSNTYYTINATINANGDCLVITNKENVTIDLNWNTINLNADSGTALIFGNPASNITIKNGYLNITVNSAGSCIYLAGNYQIIRNITCRDIGKVGYSNRGILLSDNYDDVFNLTLIGNETAYSKEWLYLLGGSYHIISNSNIGYINNGAVYSVFCNDNVTGCFGTCWGTNAFYDAAVCPNTPIINPILTMNSTIVGFKNGNIIQHIFEGKIFTGGYLLTINNTWSGGFHPYNLVLEDYNQTVCSVHLNASSFNFYLYPSSGIHEFSVYLESGDYQYVENWFQTTTVSGNIIGTQLQNCMAVNGTLGTGLSYPLNDINGTNQNEGEPQTSAQTCSEKSGSDRYICIATQPMFLWTFFLLIGAGYAEYKIKTQGKAFIGIVLLGIIVLGFFGVYPLWMTILLVVISAIVLAFIGRKLIGG